VLALQRDTLALFTVVFQM